jgi:fructokinase
MTFAVAPDGVLLRPQKPAIAMRPSCAPLARRICWIIDPPEPAPAEAAMHPDPPLIVGLGELLWDLLPGGKQLGGAPANFAYHAAALGNRGVVASRVGADALGREARDRLRQSGLETAFVQEDPSHPTGTVLVELDPQGQPRYTIIENVAWDFLEWTPAWQELAAQAQAVCFGSLAQRAHQARATIRQFLLASRPEAVRIFDVNLRQSFYSAELLRQSLQLASIAKLNQDELPNVAQLLQLPGGDAVTAARGLIETFGLQLVCVTRGAYGSVLVTAAEVDEHPGFPVTVVDTVGAGDAFTAGLVHAYLRQESLANIAALANRLGGWVATQAGAMPPVRPGEW